MENLISIFVDSVFVGNILLAYFLGMCSFLAVSKNLRTSTGAGIAVVFVLTITTPVNWLIYRYLLAPGALAWAGLPDVDLSFLKLILFIAIIAGMVQMVEMVIDRYSQALYNALGVFLPLITVNCAVLGVSLFMVERSYTFSETVVYGVGSGIGWLLAIVSMATIKHKAALRRCARRAAGLRYQHDYHRPDGHGLYALFRDYALVGTLVIECRYPGPGNWNRDLFYQYGGVFIGDPAPGGDTPARGSPGGDQGGPPHRHQRR